MTKILTLSQLKAAGACAGALRRFTAAFGESTPVTPALACKHADQFSWNWAADNLLSAPAQAAYDRATERAWAAYDRAAGNLFLFLRRHIEVDSFVTKQCLRASLPAGLSPAQGPTSPNEIMSS